jgi:hypothetical protein
MRPDAGNARSDNRKQITRELRRARSRFRVTRREPKTINASGVGYCRTLAGATAASNAIIARTEFEFREATCPPNGDETFARARYVLDAVRLQRVPRSRFRRVAQRAPRQRACRTYPQDPLTNADGPRLSVLYKKKSAPKGAFRRFNLRLVDALREMRDARCERGRAYCASQRVAIISALSPRMLIFRRERDGRSSIAAREARFYLARSDRRRFGGKCRELPRITEAPPASAPARCGNWTERVQLIRRRGLAGHSFPAN